MYLSNFKIIRFKNEMASCPRCGSDTLTTSSYHCKKHNVRYDPKKAKEVEYRCTIIPKSKCPQCSSELQMDQLSERGPYFLKCPACAWNSYSGNPKIHYLSKRIVYNEAISSKLAKKADRCNIRLKEKQGIEICPDCFSQFLKNGGITSFSTINNTYNLETEDISRIITDLKKEGKIYGQLDLKNQLFIYIPDNSKEYINEQLKDSGKISLESLSNRFKIPYENALELMYEMLKEYQIRGLFDRSKKNYYNIEYFYDWLI